MLKAIHICDNADCNNSVVTDKNLTHPVHWGDVTVTVPVNLVKTESIRLVLCPSCLAQIKSSIRSIRRRPCDGD